MVKQTQTIRQQRRTNCLSVTILWRWGLTLYRNNFKIIAIKISLFLPTFKIYWYKHAIPSMTLFKNRLTFYSTKWLNSARPFSFIHSIHATLNQNLHNWKNIKRKNRFSPCKKNININSLFGNDQKRTQTNRQQLLSICLSKWVHLASLPAKGPETSGTDFVYLKYDSMFIWCSFVSNYSYTGAQTMC